MIKQHKQTAHSGSFRTGTIRSVFILYVRISSPVTCLSAGPCAGCFIKHSINEGSILDSRSAIRLLYYRSGSSAKQSLPCLAVSAETVCSVLTVSAGSDLFRSDSFPPNSLFDSDSFRRSSLFRFLTIASRSGGFRPSLSKPASIPELKLIIPELFPGTQVVNMACDVIAGAAAAAIHDGQSCS